MNPPDGLRRFFKTEDHARSFIAGKVRFGLLEYYKTIEDSRRDETEGTAKFDWDTRAKPIHYEGSSLNPHFIICCAHLDADRSVLMERFGSYVIRINDPAVLLERINVEWLQHPWASGPCAIWPVAYDKGESLEPTPFLIPPMAYSYSQKPRKSFAVEREFRYVLTCTVEPERILGKNDLWLTLPDCSDVCELDQSYIAADV